ncbi:hypothetical protein C8Q79DRAFT_1006855 [Trametes meyenii]|nr:hypothetical protein C8Q79DRAFT_1006855 [Trametes meyenii]
MAGNRFVFYDDPPKGPHCSFINANSVRTNNVFAVDFDPCSSEPQATVIQPSDIVDPSKPLILMFTPRHEVKCINRAHQLEIHHPEVARVAKSGTRYWDMTCSDFNRVPYGSREAAVQTDPVQQDPRPRSQTVFSDAPETKVEDDTENGPRTIALVRGPGPHQCPQAVPAPQPARCALVSHAIDPVKNILNPACLLQDVEDGQATLGEYAPPTSPTSTPTLPGPASPSPGSPSALSGYSADGDTDGSPGETGSNGGWSQLPDMLEINSADGDADGSPGETGSNGGWSQLPNTLEIIMETCNIGREIEAREARLAELDEYMERRKRRRVED